MSEDFLGLVRRELLPELNPLGFAVVEAEQSNSFDNAVVVLHSPGLRIRLVRERSQIFADFGPASEHNTWFDSAVIMEYLGLSSEGGFHDRHGRRTMQGVAAFVRSFRTELSTMFAGQQLVKTKQELNGLREERAERLFGG